MKQADSKITVQPDGSTIFEGPDAVRWFQATALATGLRLYDRAKIRPNRAWTPTAMLKLASRITGKSYRRGEYLRAAADVQAWANEMRDALDVDVKS